MKHKWATIFLLGMMTMSWAQGQPPVKNVKKYIKADKVQLLANPLGKPIAAMTKGAECAVLRTQGEMVQVQITGWITQTELLDTQPVRALHIMVNSRPEADEVLSDLRSGKSFEELARARSILPNASKGGDLGYFIKGDFDPSVETAILPLQVNEISPIVEFNNKFNIFKRIE